MKLGVLALQGAFREHRQMLENCGAAVVEVRKPEELEPLDGLVIPGGESTVIGKLMQDGGLLPLIREKAAAGMAVFGTCAGMILLGKEVRDRQQPLLGLMDTVVRRNAFGRQRESFEADLCVPELGEEPMRAVFIRAPYIESAGPAVQVLGRAGGHIVIARQGKWLAAAFHPELTGDDRLHRYFLQLASQ